MPTRHITIRAALTLTLIAAATAPAAAQIQFTHVTLEPGARLTSTGADITMTVIVGEPEAAITTSGPLTLQSGFLPLVLPPACPGDATGDGAVDFDDLNLILANWGMPVPPGTSGDLDLDGDVTFSDLNLVLAEWGDDCN